MEVKTFFIYDFWIYDLRFGALPLAYQYITDEREQPTLKPTGFTSVK